MAGSICCCLTPTTTAHCFMPIHIYEATTGNPVTVFVRPVSRLPWYCAMSCVRADSHYGRPEAMDWRERNRVAYIFGIARNSMLTKQQFVITTARCCYIRLLASIKLSG